MTQQENDVLFFSNQQEWREWLEQNYDQVQEQWVGYYKTSSGIASITWPQSVDEALCFGWIDGLRKSIDETRYKIRFTPRKPGSIWSSVNVKRARQLSELGLMHPAGLKLFQERDQKKSQLYAYENRPAKLSDEYEQQFHANEKAWAFFQAQALSYQRSCIWWVMSAKQEATRQKRLATLIADSEKGEKSGYFKRSSTPT